MAGWEAERETLAFRRHYREWKKRFAEVAPFEEVGDLIDWFQDESIPYPEKDRVAVALCLLAQEGQQVATTLLTFLFRPALRKSAVELTTSDIPSHDLEARIIAAFFEAILTVTSESTMVTRHLVYGAKDGGRKDRREELRRAKREIDAERLPETDPAIGTDPQDLVGAFGLEVTPADLLESAVRDKVINAFEAGLIRATRLDGFELAATAQVLGLTYSAAAERRRRAEAGLVSWIQKKVIPAKKNIPKRVEMRPSSALSNVKGPTKEDPNKKGR